MFCLVQNVSIPPQTKIRTKLLCRDDTTRAGHDSDPVLFHIHPDSCAAFPCTKQKKKGQSSRYREAFKKPRITEADPWKDEPQPDCSVMLWNFPTHLLSFKRPKTASLPVWRFGDRLQMTPPKEVCYGWLKLFMHWLIYLVYSMWCRLILTWFRHWRWRARADLQLYAGLFKQRVQI